LNVILYSFFNDAGLLTIASADAEPSDLIVNLGTTKNVVHVKEIVTSLEAVHVTPKSVT
jgi:hypothetical protein